MKKFCIGLVGVLVGFGMTVYGIVAKDLAWQAWGWPLLLLSLHEMTRH